MGTKSEMMPISVMAECGKCQGSGLFRGFKEPPGIAVVCLDCKGSGKKILEYIPFTERKGCDDVKRVCRSHGAFGSPYGADEGISYEEFLAGHLPVR